MSQGVINSVLIHELQAVVPWLSHNSRTHFLLLLHLPSQQHQQQHIGSHNIIMTSSSSEFVPVGKKKPSRHCVSGNDVGVTKTSVLDMSDTTSSHTHSNPHSAISDSVVFFDDGQLDDVIDATNQYEFDLYDDYDEIDNLYPYNNEDNHEVDHQRRVSISKVVSTNDLGISSSIPTQLSDRESMSASSTEETLAQMILGLEKRLEMSSTNLSDDHGNLSEENNGNNENKRESIVGERTLLQMSVEEKRQLFAPNRRKKSLMDLGGLSGSDNSSTFAEGNDIIVSSVDWSSLTKSCKLAKNAFRDHSSGQNVMKKMFLNHLRPLMAVLTMYARRYCGREDIIVDGPCYSLAEIKSHTTEVKRALQFAMSCLMGKAMEAPMDGQESMDDVKSYRMARLFRQELQEAAANGFTSQATTLDEEIHYGLQISLVKIIVSSKSMRSFEQDDTMSVASTIDVTDMVSIIKEGKQRVRVLAARLLCNIVTDCPLAAEAVLKCLPFSPHHNMIDVRMKELILGYREYAEQGGDVINDGIIYWFDLVTSTANVHTAGSGGDREVLGAVVAALHNLLTSLEARESLLELDGEMKRRERSKQRREKQTSKQRTFEDSLLVRETQEQHSEKPIDIGVEIANDGVLLNALLRAMLPAKAVLMQSTFEMEMSRPKFTPPILSSDDMADSATEWISLVLERVASRGLLPQMLASIGGKSKSVTPEQVVLISCIRQTVDDYCSTMSPRAVTTVPHPLWGRSDLSAGGRSASTREVPELLSLANKMEEIRLRADMLRQYPSMVLYDGEDDFIICIIDDMSDILGQCLGSHADADIDGRENLRKSNKHFTAEARSVLGRETSLLSSCCKDLGRILDRAMSANAGLKAREMTLSSQDQQTAILMTRLIGNIVYQCRYNQDLLRVTPIPVLAEVDQSVIASFTNSELPIERTGLHVLLSATSLAPACFTLREWCIVAIRNAVEGNDANAETIRQLEANQVMSDTPELRQMGVKIDMDAKGNVQVKRRTQDPSAK